MHIFYGLFSKILLILEDRAHLVQQTANCYVQLTCDGSENFFWMGCGKFAHSLKCQSLDEDCHAFLSRNILSTTLVRFNTK